jgi:uncharacterized repeat protein (TIGR01451 family)
MKIKPLFISLALGLGLTLALLWLLSNPSTGLRVARAASYTVCLAGPPTCDYNTIQAAVNDAGDGDVIKVAAGRYTVVHQHPAPAGYNGPLFIKQVLYIDKNITICGGYTTTNWTTPYPITQPTTLDAHEQGRVVFITGDTSPTVEGLHITGGNAHGLRGYIDQEGYPHHAGGGVYATTAKATISNNQVVNNKAQLGGGLFFYHSPATLSDNTISSNTATEFGGGLLLADSSTATLSGNTISDNKAEKGGGGLCVHLSDPTLNGNIIKANIAPEGGGLRLSRYSSATLGYNTIASNIAEQGGGLYLSNYCTATLSHNDITANTARIGGGGLKLVTSTARLNHDAIKGNIAHFGGGLNLVTSTVWLTDTDVICNTADHAGGGVQLANNSSARFIGNRFTSNTSYSDGGGLHLAESSTATLSGNHFISNTAGHNGGGLFLRTHSTATLSGNTFTTNEARHGGGGMYVCDHSAASLGGDTVISNTVEAADYGGGGGLALTTISTLTCTNTIIADNRLNGWPGIGAGLVIHDSSARLLHTTIARNSGGDDSGIHVTERQGTYSTVALTNTILVGHKVGITVTARNTATLEATLWGNGNWANDARWGGAATPTHSKDYPGDPAFVDPDAGNYHIGPGSAALEKGIRAGVTVDIDDEQRPDDNPDLGADEFPPVADLAVTKTDLYDPIVAGGYNQEYGLKVTNNGPSDATDVTLTDILPTEVTINRPVLPSTCTEADGTVTCHLGGPASGESREIWLVVSVHPSTVGTITNIASVTATELDPDLSDNTVTEDTTVTKPDIEVIKKASATTAKVGDIITYTYTVTNTGGITLAVSAHDDRRGPIRLATNTLGPDETTTGAATYTVVAGDLCRSPLVNLVTVTGTSRFGDVVTDTDGASVKVRLPCLSLPAFGAVLLVILNLVFRRKK